MIDRGERRVQIFFGGRQIESHNSEMDIRPEGNMINENWAFSFYIFTLGLFFSLKKIGLLVTFG